MIVRLALALGLLLAGLLFYETVWASAWHSDDACFGQSWDNKTGPAEIWWKAVSVCTDHPAEQLSLNVNLQKFDWNSWTYRDMLVWPFYGEGPNNVAFTAASGYRAVEPGGGMYCYRIRTFHAAVELTKGRYWPDSSVSWGECY